MSFQCDKKNRGEKLIECCFPLCSYHDYHDCLRIFIAYS